MNINSYRYYTRLNNPVVFIKRAVDESRPKKKILYTEEEFNKLVEDYANSKKDKDTIDGPYEDIFNKKKMKVQDAIDDVNARIRRDKRRASGYRTFFTGLGGAAGYGAASWLSNALGWDRGDDIKDSSGKITGNAPYSWRRWLADKALKGTGFLIGGAIPHLVYRTTEGTWDMGANAIKGTGSLLSRR